MLPEQKVPQHIPSTVAPGIEQIVTNYAMYRPISINQEEAATLAVLHHSGAALQAAVQAAISHNYHLPQQQQQQTKQRAVPVHSTNTPQRASYPHGVPSCSINSPQCVTDIAVIDHEIQGYARLPARPGHVPLTTELSHLGELLRSWIKAYATQRKPPFALPLSLRDVLASKNKPLQTLHMEYIHDGLRHETFPLLGAKACAGGETHYYLRITLSNNGYLYPTIPEEHIALGNVCLHRGNTHPDGIPGYVLLTEKGAAPFAPFAAFATTWFDCRPEDLHQRVFCNTQHNRADVVLERRNFPRPSDRVTLEFRFEPGVPTEEFDRASFRVTRNYIEGGRREGCGALF